MDMGVLERISFTFLFKQLELFFIDLFYTYMYTLREPLFGFRVGCVREEFVSFELSLGLVQEYFTRT